MDQQHSLEILETPPSIPLSQISTQSWDSQLGPQLANLSNSQSTEWSQFCQPTWSQLLYQPTEWSQLSSQPTEFQPTEFQPTESQPTESQPTES